MPIIIVGAINYINVAPEFISPETRLLSSAASYGINMMKFFDTMSHIKNQRKQEK